MHPAIRHPHFRPVEYDSIRRRLWIFGQRCHHGATGALVASAACVAIAAERQVAGPLVALAATGGMMMVHDWKDHSFWFELGYGSQP
jgi:hypothetical protein